MPTYQYACTECSHRFEQVQSFSEDALTVCPECQGRLRKLFNAVGVVFKGSGFYRNDSRSESRTGGESGSGFSDSSSSGAAEKKSADSGASTSSGSDSAPSKSSGSSDKKAAPASTSSSSSGSGSSSTSGSKSSP